MGSIILQYETDIGKLKKYNRILTLSTIGRPDINFIKFCGTGRIILIYKNYCYKMIILTV
jgi:hypothetical protein